MTSPLNARKGIVGRDKLEWRRQGRGSGLFYGKSKTALLRIMPDEVYPDMWRIKLSKGYISDFANESWIKDAALAIAMAMLNSRKGQETASPGRPVARNKLAATPVADSSPDGMGA